MHLKIKSAPSYPSYLFSRAHRKQWRSKRLIIKTEKDYCKAEKEHSIDQITMDLPIIVPQLLGKTVIKNYSKSQLALGYHSYYCHINHLEYFTIKSRTRSNRQHECGVPTYRNTAKNEDLETA